MNKNSHLTSKDKNRNHLVNGGFKICNIPNKCSGSNCDEMRIINQMIRRLYELEHGEIKD